MIQVISYFLLILFLVVFTLTEMSKILVVIAEKNVPSSKIKKVDYFNLKSSINTITKLTTTNSCHNNNIIRDKDNILTAVSRMKETVDVVYINANKAATDSKLSIAVVIEFS